jgi:hypothetical protein
MMMMMMTLRERLKAQGEKRAESREQRAESR